MPSGGARKPCPVGVVCDKTGDVIDAYASKAAAMAAHGIGHCSNLFLDGKWRLLSQEEYDAWLAEQAAAQAAMTLCDVSARQRDDTAKNASEFIAAFCRRHAAATDTTAVVDAIAAAFPRASYPSLVNMLANMVTTLVEERRESDEVHAAAISALIEERRKSDEMHAAVISALFGTVQQLLHQ